MNRFFWLMVFLFGCSTSLYSPAGLGVPPTINSEIRNAAILRGISNAGWTLDEQREDSFFVKYQDDEASATVSVWQTDKILHFSYYEIEGERDLEKMRELHSNEYNKMMIRLEEQIALELAKVL